MLIFLFYILQVCAEIHNISKTIVNTEVGNPIHWSFLGRNEGCPAQQWHRDRTKGFFCIFPLYPPKKYTVSVIKGSHKVEGNYRACRAPVSLKKCCDELIHLELDVGQVLIGNGKIIHRGGPSSECMNMPMSYNGVKENTIGGFKNLSIHCYLSGDNKQQEEDITAGDKTIYATFKE